MHWIFKAHLTLGLTILLVFPFTRLVHMLSAPIWYLNRRGWQSFYEPRACLIHHESKSRGFDRDAPGKARFAGELAALKRIWKTDILHDPFHHPELSEFSEQFVVRL